MTEYWLSDVELESLQNNAVRRGARLAEHAATCDVVIQTCDCPVAVRYRVLVVERDVFVEGLRRIP